MTERRFKTAANRWGPGRVHRLIYSRENRVWYIACRGPYRSQPFGDRTADNAEVTCRRCLA